MIKAEVRYNSKLSEIEKRFAIPLLTIAQQLVPGMGRRIQQGIASQGMFRAMGADSKPRDGKGLWWVHPAYPQPGGYVVKATSGAYAGWAGYESYVAYLVARGLNGQPRNFTESGALWQSLRIRVNGPARVKVAFFGAHKYIAPPPTPDGGTPEWQRRPGDRVRGGRSGGGTKRYNNGEVAFLASRQEPAPMLTPSRMEIAEVAKQFQNEVSAQLIGQAADAQDIRQMGQRLTRLQTRLSAQALGRR